MKISLAVSLPELQVTPVSEINEFKFKICNTISDLSDNYQILVRKKLPPSLSLR